MKRSDNPVASPSATRRSRITATTAADTSDLISSEEVENKKKKNGEEGEGVRPEGQISAVATLISSNRNSDSNGKSNSNSINNFSNNSIISNGLSYESISFTLPQLVQKTIATARNAATNETLLTPIKSDIEYFELLEVLYLVKVKEHNLLEMAPNRIFDCRLEKIFGNYRDQGLINGLQAAEILNGIFTQIDEYRFQRLAITTEIKPRLERLLHKLGKASNEFERRVFEYLFLMQTSDVISNELFRNSGMNYPGGFGGNPKGTPFYISRLFNYDVTNIYKMFSLVDPWIKENIFSSVSNPREDIIFSSEGNCMALIGIPLSSTQFLSIQSQVIQSIVSEEPGFKDSPAGRCNDLGDRQNSNNNYTNGASFLPTSATALIAGGADFAQSGFKNMEALYSTLRKGEYQSQGVKGMVGVDSGAASGGGVTSTDSSDDAFRADNSSSSSSLDMDGAPASQIDLIGTNELALSSSSSSSSSTTNNDFAKIGGDDIDLTEYKNDLSYLQDQMLLTNCVSKISKLSRSLEDVEGEFDDDGDVGGFPHHTSDNYDPNSGRMLEKEQVLQKKSNSLRKLKQKERILRGKIARRLSLTQSSQNGWYPRLEKLVLALGLCAFEKFVIMYLIGTVISPKPQGRVFRGGGGDKKCKCSVNDLLNSFSNSLEEQMGFRKYFYKTSILVKEGILNMMGQDFMSDLTDCEVEIDRRMLDFVVGLDTEFSEIVDGSHLYTPTVEFEDVILPEEMKNLISDTVSNFDRLKEVEKELELDKKISYGRGMALLFYGSSGTGKTMLANAIATKLRRKVLLINFPTLGGNSAGSIIKLIFREAKIHNAIIFFDECESLFHSRDDGSRNVNMILTELERHDGLSIMATNRPSDLDEAMHRRISLALEFRKPDHILRQRIWKSLCPAKLQLNADVSLEELAMKFELTGGFIKNTWLSALSFAVARDKVNPVVSQDDLKKAASHQLRGRLSMVDFDRRIIPTRGLDSVILPTSIKSAIQDIIDFGKAQSILYGQWGFSSQHGGCKGIGALFSGPPGTGKTMAAEAIGYDLGRPIKVVNCAQLVSKWVGESAKNIQAVFDEAKAVDAILVFDEAEGLFGSRSGSEGSSGRHDDMNVGILLHHIETFSGVVVVITNLKDRIDNAFFRRFKFVLEFPLPNVEERLRLWRLLIPKEAPLSANVDLNYLATHYDGFTGGNIKTAVFRAASRAALRAKLDQRVITMDDLKKAAEEESGKDSSKKAGACSMFS